jgi:hypothetical protein
MNLGRNKNKPHYIYKSKNERKKEGKKNNS